jgi:hypothetical protein
MSVFAIKSITIIKNYKIPNQNPQKCQKKNHKKTPKTPQNPTKTDLNFAFGDPFRRRIGPQNCQFLLFFPNFSLQKRKLRRNKRNLPILGRNLGILSRKMGILGRKMTAGGKITNKIGGKKWDFLWFGRQFLYEKWCENETFCFKNGCFKKM